MSKKFVANILLFLFDFKKPIHYDRWNKWNTSVGGEGETKRKNHDSSAAGGEQKASLTLQPVDWKMLKRMNESS